MLIEQPTPPHSTLLSKPCPAVLLRGSWRMQPATLKTNDDRDSARSLRCHLERAWVACQQLRNRACHSAHLDGPRRPLLKANGSCSSSQHRRHTWLAHLHVSSLSSRNTSSVYAMYKLPFGVPPCRRPVPWRAIRMDAVLWTATTSLRFHSLSNSPPRTARLTLSDIFFPRPGSFREFL